MGYLLILIRLKITVNKFDHTTQYASVKFTPYNGTYNNNIELLYTRLHTTYSKKNYDVKSLNPAIMKFSNTIYQLVQYNKY